MEIEKPVVLFVGAFPKPGKSIYGGNVSACKALLDSSFATQLDLFLVDTTQIRIPAPNIFVRSILALRRMFVYAYQFERCRPDAVLLFVASGASVIEKGVMAWYSHFRGVPALVFPRAGVVMEKCRNSVVWRTITRLSFGGAEKVLCQQKAWQDFAKDTLGLDERRAPIVRNWTASQRFLNIGQRRNEEDNEIVRLLYVGWTEERKGIFDLLSALEGLECSRCIEVAIVGDGGARAEAERIASIAEMGASVRFFGWLDGEQLTERFEESDIFVLPSWSEGLPNAMVEAMAARLAIISTDVGSIPDVISNETNGLLTRPKNVEHLRECIAAVVDNPALRWKLASSAYEMARELYTIEPAVDRLVAEIHDCVKD